jgi:DNA-binding winged helix-turn-helix (wHTH) protein
MQGEPRVRLVLIAADDDLLIRALAEHRPAGAGWRFARLEGPIDADAIVIVDLEDGADRDRRVQAIREGGFAGPALILGGGPAEAMPEDEPLPRPVRLGVLLSRLDAHWAQGQGAMRRRLGPYEFSPADRSLRHADSGAVIRLTELERRLLSFLAEAAGAPVSREALLAGVWGYSPGTLTHTVETHIWRLRQKIETDDVQTRFLTGEAGGYRLALAAVAQDG